MNFFQSIAELTLSGDLRINITQTPSGRMAVSVMLVHHRMAEEAQKQFKPLVLSGSPSELDEGFIQKISIPMQATAHFYDNTEAYLNTLEQAKKTGAQRPTGGRAQPLPKTETEKKLEKYAESMKKADELEKEGKFRDAWMKVPDIAEYPDKEPEIRARRQALSAQFEPDLFS